MHIYIPNCLTYLRLVLVPALIFFFYFPCDYQRLICTAIFILASISDWLDGYLARRWQVESTFGAFMDPVADKVLVAVALLLLSSDHYPFNPLWITIPSAIVISREILISALREWMAAKNLNHLVKVSILGKYKTTVQMMAVICLLYQQSLWLIPMQWLGMLLLWLATILTIWSMSAYLLAAWSHIHPQMSKK